MGLDKILLWAVWKTSCDLNGSLATNIKGGDLDIAAFISEIIPGQEYENINPFLGQKNYELSQALHDLMQFSTQSFSGTRINDSPLGSWGTEVNMAKHQNWSIAMPVIKSYNRKIEEGS